MSPIPPVCPDSGGTSIAVLDTNSVDLTLAGGDLSADVRLDPASPLMLSAGAGGLMVTGAQAIHEPQQTAAFSAGPSGVVFTGVITNAEKGSLLSVNPNGVTWGQGYNNPSLNGVATVTFEARASGFELTPPLDGTVVRWRRVTNMTLSAGTDADSHSETGEATYVAAEGPILLAPHSVRLTRAIGVGGSIAMAVTDDIQVWWTSVGDMGIVPTTARNRVIVDGKIV